MATRKNTSGASASIDFEALLKEYSQNASGRIFLSEQRKFAQLPDLLSLQKKGFEDFVKIYIHKLFEDVNPIQDIAGEKHVIEIDEVEISSPLYDIDMCKKKELTYGGVISAKVKLIDSVSKKVLFSKKANVGIMPIIPHICSL